MQALCCANKTVFRLKQLSHGLVITDHLLTELCCAVQDCLQAEAAERQASHAALAARQHLQQVLQVCANQQGWAQVPSLRHC